MPRHGAHPALVLLALALALASGHLPYAVAESVAGGWAPGASFVAANMSCLALDVVPAVPTLVDPLSNALVELWLRPRALPSDRLAVAAAHTPAGFVVGLTPSGRLLAAIGACPAVESWRGGAADPLPFSGSSCTLVASKAALAAGPFRWIHVVISWSPASQTLSLIVDDKGDAAVTADAGFSWAIGPGAFSLSLGCLDAPSSGTTDAFFDGWISGLALFNSSALAASSAAPYDLSVELTLVRALDAAPLVYAAPLDGEYMPPVIGRASGSTRASNALASPVWGMFGPPRPVVIAVGNATAAAEVWISGYEMVGNVPSSGALLRLVSSPPAATAIVRPGSALLLSAPAQVDLLPLLTSNPADAGTVAGLPLLANLSFRGEPWSGNCGASLLLVGSPASWDGNSDVCGPKRAVERDVPVCGACPPFASCNNSSPYPVALPGFAASVASPGTFVTCRNCAGDGSCKAGATGELCALCLPGYYQYRGACEICPSAGSRALWSVGLFALILLLVFLKRWFASLSVAANFVQIMGVFANVDLEWPSTLTAMFTVFSAFSLNLDLISLPCTIDGLGLVGITALKVALPAFFAVIWLVAFAIVAAIRTRCCTRSPGAHPQSAVAPAYSPLQANAHGPPIADTELVELGQAEEQMEESEPEPEPEPEPASKSMLSPPSPPSLSRGDVLVACGVDGFISTFTVLVNILYISQVAALTDVLQCELKSDGRYVLSRYENITCYDGGGEWARALFVACAGLVVSIAGVPIWYWHTMRRHALELDSEAFRRRYGVMCYKYDRDYFWWELVIFLRKLAVTAVTGILPVDPVWKAAAGIIVFLGFGLLQVFAHPFVSQVLDGLESIGMALSFFLLAIGLVFHSDSMTSSEESALLIIAIAVLVAAVVVVTFAVALDVQSKVSRFALTRLLRGAPSSAAADAALVDDMVHAPARPYLASLQAQLRESLLVVLGKLEALCTDEIAQAAVLLGREYSGAAGSGDADLVHRDTAAARSMHAMTAGWQNASSKSQLALESIRSVNYVIALLDHIQLDAYAAARSTALAQAPGLASRRSQLLADSVNAPARMTGIFNRRRAGGIHFVTGSSAAGASSLPGEWWARKAQE
ncbi:uncharacterized protein AMSG_00954 [Thecamonas trahens ATCC 50062]|uniref:Laminin EGF-like domain-containing protein n=1 Tax=Thecamonas trahens ATCC 50062 TaxID=461836 RepID=A0A0L0DL71_THETB|nr:hypothetical protein AMSG_00954 [Thecamonas trahens ATCC 50062]KNC52128.1 hypothetical protein AMSG_00954 [Thecamonas trahens ATCC 50062]|eukprot:XP_013762132.1 hypothetical protein AMSG_00954 [Thecamonas trahens ATCC 50062]